MVVAVDVERERHAVKVHAHAELPSRFRAGFAPTSPKRQTIKAVERRGEGLLNIAVVDSIRRKRKNLIPLDLVGRVLSPGKSVFGKNVLRIAGV